MPASANVALDPMPEFPGQLRPWPRPYSVQCVRTLSGVIAVQRVFNHVAHGIAVHKGYNMCSRLIAAGARWGTVARQRRCVISRK